MWPVEAGQYSYATELAERYEDFRVLVQLCEETGNRGQLREYMQNYKSQVSLFLLTTMNLHSVSADTLIDVLASLYYSVVLG